MAPPFLRKKFGEKSVSYTQTYMVSFTPRKAAQHWLDKTGNKVILHTTALQIDTLDCIKLRREPTLLSGL